MSRHKAAVTAWLDARAELEKASGALLEGPVAMTVHHYDVLDRTLLSLCRTTPLTLTELVDASGFGSDATKGLLQGYLHADLVTRMTGLTARYQLTLTGHSRLTALTGQSAQPALQQAA